MNKFPKLTIYQVINKSLISWGIKANKNLPVYYKWDKKRLPKINSKTGSIIFPFILIDYDKNKREWYINLLKEHDKILSATVDDVTGTAYITSLIY